MKRWNGPIGAAFFVGTIDVADDGSCAPDDESARALSASVICSTEPERLPNIFLTHPFPDTSMDLMPHDLTPRDDAGRPLDYEQHAARCERETRERDELRVERYHAPENPDLVAFRVVDRSGKVRGFIGFEWEAMETDLPDRTLGRVQRGAGVHPKPDLRLVG